MNTEGDSNGNAEETASSSRSKTTSIALAFIVTTAMLAAGVWFFAVNPFAKQLPPIAKLSLGTNAKSKPKIDIRLINELSVAPTPASKKPRLFVDTSGYGTMTSGAIRWQPTDSLEDIRKAWEDWPTRLNADLDGMLQQSGIDSKNRVGLFIKKASCQIAAGEPEKALEILKIASAEVEAEGGETKDFALSSLIFFQGIAALRIAENDNCVLCRGESSCILPISPGAIHQNPKGSRLAIEYFTEYLNEFPEDMGVRWLLNVAHMTLGEHPEKVDPRFLVSLDQFRHSKQNIGKFRDIGENVGVNRYNQAGGVIMEDFDNDGLLDLAVTTFDPTKALDLYRNQGDGTFEVVTEKSPNLSDQFGGLVCIQTDYDNDGLVDIYIPRGAWLHQAVRPSLLKNMGDFRFKDVTVEAGLIAPLNSNSAAWADYDNDGFIDLFICCEKQSHRLYRNLGNGKFQNMTNRAGVSGDGEQFGKACTWIDYDNDDYPDLFITHLNGVAQLYHNNRNGMFSNVTAELGIKGPQRGFTCWTWDYNNDGWQDIFATCYDQTLGDVVNGLVGMPHQRNSNKLYKNLEGKGFQDVTQEVGLDLVFATMGANCGDFDNDGFLDFYLGTGSPDLSLLVPNRMFTNIRGKQFAEVTGSAGVGHLQKGHAVACGDWDRDGNLDIFIQMGGAVDGDRFRNILFQNPGHDNSWLTVKLIGTKSNRAALGARIKVVTSGESPQSIYRHISPGSSFGSSPLEQTVGLGKARQVATLEVRWPTSHTTQTLHDISVNQSIEITEGTENYRVLEQKRVPLPK